MSSCLEVAKLLEKEKISVKVVNMHTIKPIDKSVIDESVENMVNSVSGHFGTIDILVNCAATPLGQVPIVTGENFHNQLFLHLIQQPVKKSIMSVRM